MSPTGAATSFHAEIQDTSAPGWLGLLELIEVAVDDGREEFRPLPELSPEERRQIVTLPVSIGRLTAVGTLVLYGSNLVRIPPEIGDMTSLEEFGPYTSRRLHFPARNHAVHSAGEQHGEHALDLRQLQVPAAVPTAPPARRHGP
ncbi:hypothetical protein ABZ646_24180 [Streptomyces sp. NPDC007162]|uniref:hypothetical protein n=1 Tax=Streptomyces sp. NPDC007162 TaxID=3156917 RepID=UPI0033E781BE